MRSSLPAMETIWLDPGNAGKTVGGNNLPVATVVRNLEFDFDECVRHPGAPAVDRIVGENKQLGSLLDAPLEECALLAREQAVDVQLSFALVRRERQVPSPMGFFGICSRLPLVTAGLSPEAGRSAGRRVARVIRVGLRCREPRQRTELIPRDAAVGVRACDLRQGPNCMRHTNPFPGCPPRETVPGRQPRGHRRGSVPPPDPLAVQTTDLSQDLGGCGVDCRDGPIQRLEHV